MMWSEQSIQFLEQMKLDWETSNAADVPRPQHVRRFTSIDHLLADFGNSSLVDAIPAQIMKKNILSQKWVGERLAWTHPSGHWSMVLYLGELLKKNKQGKRTRMRDLVWTRMMKWFMLLFEHYLLCLVPVSSSEPIVIRVLFLPTSATKRIPEEGGGQTIEHVNSAFTQTRGQQRVASSDIVIFRKEEWFKVFLHESFHAAHADYAYEMTGLSAELKLFETFCETWATLLHALFVLPLHEFWQAFFRENEFAALQSFKLLNQEEKDGGGDKDVRDILRQNEQTPYVAYHVFKFVLLENINEFLAWSIASAKEEGRRRHPLNPPPLASFEELLQKSMEEEWKRHQNGTSRMLEFEDGEVEDNAWLMQTMRMTITPDRATKQHM